MSYSRQEGNEQRGSFAGRQWRTHDSATALLADSAEATYMSNSRKVGDIVRRIQANAADVRKETRLLSTSACNAGRGRSKIRKIAGDSKTLAAEAERLLAGIAVSGPEYSVQEQHHRRTTQQKLSDNLAESTKAIHEAVTAYEAIAPKEVTVADGKSEAQKLDVEVEMDRVDVECGQHCARVQELDVTAAEMETHTAIVEEYVQEVQQLSQDVLDLHRCMADLAEYAQQQGEVLDDVEANVGRASDSTSAATEQLVTASNTQRRNMKQVCWISVTVCVLLVTVVATLANR
mmetsp:Transcript_61933/g.108461  ORF Transcript_61933/g.108461 Transcript_61933/m.108461 type:complete len:290 (+) Transcript_61933:95-964(+)